MAKLQRKPRKPGRKVLRNGRSGEAYEKEAYASIAASMLSSHAFRKLSGHAVGVLLLLHAAYNPNSELFLGHRQARDLLDAGPNSISKAFRELETAGFIVKIRDAIRPGGMGSSGKGKAAVYDLPGRNVELPINWLQQRDPRLQGYWRIHSAQIRAVVQRISVKALKLWCFMHAVHRQANGAPQSNEPRRFDADAVGLAPETLRLKIIELSEVGIIKLAQAASGRRSATYVLSESECRSVSTRSTRHLPATPMGG